MDLKRTENAFVERARPAARAALLALAVAAGLGPGAGRSEGQEGSPPASTPSHAPRMGRGWSLDADELVNRAALKLDLGADQQEGMKGLIEGFWASHAGALARARELRDALQAAHGSGTPPSREDVEALARQYGNPRRELAPALRQLRADARSLLDPEQRRELEDLRSRWRHGCRGEHGPRPGFGPDGFAPRPPPPVPPS